MKLAKTLAGVALTVALSSCATTNKEAIMNPNAAKISAEKERTQPLL